jgi:hypothetical protein
MDTLLNRRAAQSRVGDSEPPLLLQQDDENEMTFRRRTHKLWRERSNDASSDRGAEGLKNAIIGWSNSWYVGVSLAMSVSFAMVLFKPNAKDTLDHQIALYMYLGFTLRACYLSLTAITGSAMWVQQASKIPAAQYSKFLRACKMEKPWLLDAGDIAGPLFGHLMFATVPLCYIEYGYIGLAFASIATVRFVQQHGDVIVAWQTMESQFDAELGVKSGAYASDWGGYGRNGVQGFFLVFYHLLFATYLSSRWCKCCYQWQQPRGHADETDLEDPAPQQRAEI